MPIAEGRLDRRSCQRELFYKNKKAEEGKEEEKEELNQNASPVVMRTRLYCPASAMTASASTTS
jgi:hypothetical protein